MSIIKVIEVIAESKDGWEEAAQDAFVRAYRALATYEPARIRDLRLRGWLSTIVLNGCRSIASRRAARGSPPRTLEELGQCAALPGCALHERVQRAHPESSRLL